MERPRNNPESDGFFERVHPSDPFELWDLVRALRHIEGRLDRLEQDQGQR